MRPLVWFLKKRLFRRYRPDFEIILTIFYSLLKIQLDHVILKTMSRKVIHIFISILVLLPLFTGMPGFSQLANNYLPSFQKPCDMDDCDMDNCNSHMPKCPLCPSSSSVNLYLHQEADVYLPTRTSSIILICLNPLSDQEFVKTIFHPPTLLL